MNARNLKTLEVDRGTFARLAPRIPDHVVRIAESGVRGPHDVFEYAKQGANVVLVGETLVRGREPPRRPWPTWSPRGPTPRCEQRDARPSTESRAGPTARELRPAPFGDGRFGRFGGRMMPEALMAALDELTDAWQDAMADPDVHRRVRAAAA